jgi:hypothetical protein
VLADYFDFSAVASRATPNRCTSVANWSRRVHRTLDEPAGDELAGQEGQVRRVAEQSPSSTPVCR